MQTHTAESVPVRLHSLTYGETKTYLFAALFIAGNILLPQLCHLAPLGGVRWLPIYFFTLVGACKYGWRVGLLTALLSPLINSALFGMPAAAALPPILAKSLLLAGAAGYAAARFRKASLAVLAAVILTYQAAGTLFEWAWIGDLQTALQDFRIGVPGMLLQLFGGWLVINRLIRRETTGKASLCLRSPPRPMEGRGGSVSGGGRKKAEMNGKKPEDSGDSERARKTGIPPRKKPEPRKEFRPIRLWRRTIRILIDRAIARSGYASQRRESSYRPT